MDCKEYQMTKDEWAIFNNDKKAFHFYSEQRQYCYCGHSVVIRHDRQKIICSHCGHWIFKNKKDEFIYRLREKLR